MGSKEYVDLVGHRKTVVRLGFMDFYTNLGGVAMMGCGCVL